MKYTLRACLALLTATLALSVGVAEAQQTGPCPPPPTAVASPISPSGNTLDTRPTFSWTSVPGYIYYVFKLLYADPTGVFVYPPGGLVTIYGTSFTPPSDLLIDHGMRWQVKVACVKPDGGWAYGQYGPEASFTIVDPDPGGGSCNQCFGGLNACEAACQGGVCERKVNCGTSGYKCFC
jgi:hypothetical protein